MSHSFAKFVKNDETVDVTSGKYVFGLRDVNKIVVATSLLNIEAVICCCCIVETQAFVNCVEVKCYWYNYL